ncbi:prepilin-type N-terminal cleavage/methylation domain-containing protein [Candidatus Parcubacteria bacterium]|nr:prepilin-type N-terminal cleavage/methylation domain-containing protein [Candidatus Parcubacteria bacterium]
MNQFSNNKGFTLIEVVVSIFMFFSIFVVILGFFGYAVKGQKKALASQEISDQISYVMEYMSRSIRMANKDVGGTCIAAGKNYEITTPMAGYSCIRFLNYDNKCQEFCFDSNNNQLKRRKSGDGGSGGLVGSEVDITSSKLKVNSAQFNIIGNGIGDNIQPKITISLDVEKNAEKPEYNAQIKIQSTISQRNLDTN